MSREENRRSWTEFFEEREKRLEKEKWIEDVVGATLAQKAMTETGDIDVSPKQVEKLAVVLGGYYEAMKRGMRRDDE